MTTTPHPGVNHTSMTLPAYFWRGLMLVALLLGVAWINYSRLPIDYQDNVVAVTVPSVDLRTLGFAIPASIGLGITAGVVLMMLGRNRIPRSTKLDNLAFVAISVLIALAFGQFVAGTRYGMPTVLWWGVEVWGVRRHPVQLYEAAALIIVVVALWRRLPVALPGEIFWYGLLYVGTTELILDAFRSASRTAMAGIRIPQVVALSAMLLALYIISFYASQHQQREAGEHD